MQQLVHSYNKMKMYKLTLIAVSAFLSACGGGENDANESIASNSADTTIASDNKARANGANSIAAVDNVVDALICATGGSRIRTGLDSDGSGVLDPAEVKDTAYVCNGLNGVNGLTSLVVVTPEAVGANCSTGGNKIQTGLDTNANGTLNPAEVTSTQFICNGPSQPIIDSTPPQITTTAPLVAESSRVNFKTLLSDNVELGFYSLTGYFDKGKYAPEGAKTLELDDFIDVPLGQTATKTIVAVDTSGNVSKRNVSITSPQPSLKFGNYRGDTEYTLPTGFDCRPSWVSNSIDGTVIDRVELKMSEISGFERDLILQAGLPTYIWSVAEGYNSSFTIYFAGNNEILVFSSTATPIQATSITFESQAGYSFSNHGSYNGRWAGSYSLVQELPQTIRVNLRLECNINGAGFVSGTTAQFDVAYSSPLQ